MTAQSPIRTQAQHSTAQEQAKGSGTTDMGQHKIPPSPVISDPRKNASPAKATSKPLDMGVYASPHKQPRISSIEVIAGIVSVLWLVAVSFVFLVIKPGLGATPVDFVTTLMAVFLPVALIWVGASAAKTARIMREESARLQSAIDAMRHAYIEQQQNAGAQLKSAMEDKLDKLAQAQARAEAALEGLGAAHKNTPAQVEPNPSRPATPEKTDQANAPQPSLALSGPKELNAAEEPLSMSEFIRGVNFPENEKDKEGFRTLRRALRDPKASRLIKAAQDILTLLSKDGIYMDDLLPDRAKPDIWRRFAAGETGRAVAALGGVRDRSSLALASGRMKTDPAFREAALNFLREFDRVTCDVIPQASDLEIAQLANTRTARAFMLLARVSGTFD